MPATLFIADLHLSQDEPAITAGFLSFLANEAPAAEALYILGDLFEVWIGDDDSNPLHQQIATALHKLQEQGVPCYFIHGNRDFLLGQHFARRAGMQLLPAEQMVNLYGEQVLIMHGDTLCTDDTGYQRFRRQVQQPWLQRLFLALPLSLRQRIAARMRDNSRQANQYKSLDIMDVNQQAVEQRMRHYQVQRLIHGHTHRPAVHRLTVNDAPAERMVLGAWHHQGSMIKVTPDGAQFIAFPL
ncbi:UDP-2,3-diacylglucosamine diphosphatase [Erwinia sp. OLTSP20]|uniref:UDP-2,3-diacylglucosamine diphosphatase n=1 Tax=unclassified Erwinia TaxID=2622719 RepID=UPI000C199F65|nr:MULTISPECIES: UDP-2,3-diacylglucosamine diphosphatase [unclassified Erwinia]PIJ50638.1 UDP-2,3-diacylglucosamine diphosphatase [Erwinia sp. OAMSP11]PIJ72684.1 UDP-2,3-diacylglucosamine diphosphatase [Erwinia sp. OLSSP12]PIJ83234.1 UDP-2,3-diacylglucosamine diphosphatase [Erwinia sp. OLCASP19]PIJ85265.1 UDP-2,3-diacylglucosamine diphosphatase [Erwinia sp. OLMTSP26]PIJ87267.1 UDP-2,3-diacylglucosamine diphosphatase [Erwinia sp. OLMDSP33]